MLPVKESQTCDTNTAGNFFSLLPGCDACFPPASGLGGEENVKGHGGCCFQGLSVAMRALALVWDSQPGCGGASFGNVLGDVPSGLHPAATSTYTSQ